MAKDLYVRPFPVDFGSSSAACMAANALTDKAEEASAAGAWGDAWAYWEAAEACWGALRDGGNGSAAHMAGHSHDKGQRAKARYRESLAARGVVV